MALMSMSDCTTPLEDMKLLNAKDYMALVSSGLSGFGDDPPSVFSSQVQSITDVITAIAAKFAPRDGVSKPRRGQRYEYPWYPDWGTPAPAPVQNQPFVDPRFVSGLGIFTDELSGLGDADEVKTYPTYGVNSWVPGPRPEPLKWTNPSDGVTWSQKLVDGKWVYQSSKDERYYISTSNLYDLMRLHKNPESGLVTGPIPGTQTRYFKPDDIDPKWWLLGGIGLFILFSGNGR